MNPLPEVTQEVHHLASSLEAPLLSFEQHKFPLRHSLTPFFTLHSKHDDDDDDVEAVVLCSTDDGGGLGKLISWSWSPLASYSLGFDVSSSSSVLAYDGSQLPSKITIWHGNSIWWETIRCRQQLERLVIRTMDIHRNRLLCRNGRCRWNAHGRNFG